MATARRTGRAEYDEHVQGVEAAEIDVGLRETDRPRDELLAELRRQFSTLPGTNVTIGQPISHRIDHMLSGTRANIAVKVFGDDLSTLRRLGESVRAAMASVPGVADLSLEQQMDVPFVRFVLNRPTIARYGLRPGDVAEAIETSFAGRDRRAHLRPGHGVRSDREVRPVCRRRLRADCRSADRHADGRHRAGASAGGRAPRTRAEHGAARERPAPDRRSPATSPGAISGSVVDGHPARRWRSRCRCRPAIALSTAASSKASRARRSGCWGSASLVIAGLFMLLVLAFGRARDALLVMVNLPLALIGGVVGVFLAGGVLNVATMIGFITLFGIATRNGIMLVSHIQHLMTVEGVTDFREAVERGADERLVPILMTAMAAGLALIPLALGGGQSGSEIQTPMAIVILCGLTTSTLLNMFVVPTLYLKYGRPRMSASEV